MKIIVGLGNPGLQYRNTRHNVGFMVADRLAEQWATSFSQQKHGGLLAAAHWAGGPVLVVKPLTYMNNSGQCVAEVVRYKNATPEDLIVIMDDVDLPLGKLRLRTEGSAGGHNGLKSIVQHLGTENFSRLRLGVGSCAEGVDLANYVLGSFFREEMEQRDQMISRAVEAVESALAKGVAQAMNEFN